VAVALGLCSFHCVWRNEGRYLGRYLGILKTIPALTFPIFCLKDFMKDVAFDINRAEDDLDLLGKTVIVY